MDEIFRSTVKINVDLERSFLCLVVIRAPASILLFEEPFLTVSNGELNYGEECVDYHGLSESISHL